jgi:hypothetical protein
MFMLYSLTIIVAVHINKVILKMAKIDLLYKNYRIGPMISTVRDRVNQTMHNSVKAAN